MPCARGCCDTPAEHYRSVHVAHPGRARMRKVTTTDTGVATVDQTEHWHDRQDVLVTPRTVHATLERPS